jgi:hypothetical protein
MAGVRAAPILPSARPGTLPAAKETRVNRLFRQPERGGMGYAALAIFALAYIFAMMLVLAPGQILPAPAAAVVETAE